MNRYMHQSRISEQGLMDGLIKESIQMLGQTYYYLPRNMQISDPILGEDVVSKFTLAIPIEAYLVDSQGFQGDREMFSKFGLNIQNQYKLVVHKSRWEEEVKSQFDMRGGYDWNGEANFTIDNYIRPREGDLIYDPMTKFLMEVKFVDHDVEFYALGRNYQYYLSCEAFQYQQNEISTGVSDIDAFALNSLDKLLNQILMEDGAFVTFEQEGYLILEDGVVDKPNVYGVDYQPMQGTIEYTVANPFSL